MKKFTSLLSALLLVSGLCSCGKADKSKKTDSSAATSVSEENEVTAFTETASVSEDEKNEASDSEVISESDFVGKWELVKIFDNGEELTEEMTGGIPLYALCRFEMKDDFTAVTNSVFLYNGEIADEITEWEWEITDGSKAYLHNSYTQFSDVQTYVVIEDGFLVLCEGEDTGNKAYLERVDEFHSVEGLVIEVPAEPEN